jgi:hypothetical protein
VCCNFPYQLYFLLYICRKNNLNFKYANIEKISSVVVPLLIMHGLKDTMIPVSHGESLFHAFENSSKFGCVDKANSTDQSCPWYLETKKISKFVEISDAGHDDTFQSQEWLMEVPTFIDLL